MDILELLTNKDRIDYSNNFNYQTNFKGDSMFPSIKTENIKLALLKLLENGNLPVMAQVHALDTEARIGDRPDYRELDVQKLLIKEKLNQTERIAQFLNGETNENTVKDFVYDDMGNLISRVLTRIELFRMQLLSEGKIVINENNYKTTVDFGYDTTHNDNFTNWSDPKANIIADLDAIKSKAKKKGYTITRALTSDKIIGYLCANEGLTTIINKGGQIATRERVINFIYENFGIQFDTNDELYKESAKSKTTHRFYPENKITFIAGNEILGNTIYGVTPEELSLTKSADVTMNGYVAVTQWDTPDPVATWTKASAMCLPAMNDIDRLFIVTVTA